MNWLLHPFIGRSPHAGEGGPATASGGWNARRGEPMRTSRFNIQGVERRALRQVVHGVTARPA